MGVSQKDAEAWVAAASSSAPTVFEVWAENWRTVEVFQALDTQWRIAAGPMGSRVQGIDYAAIPPTLALMDVRKRDRKSVFNGLRIMERSVLDTWYSPETKQ